MAEVQKFASFATEDMKEGTGLFDDVDATLTNLQFTKEAPDNYAAQGNPIFAVVHMLLTGDAPEEERKVSQSYSLGAQAGDNFTISEDGYKLIPTNDDAAPRADSKFGTFCKYLQASQVPASLLKNGDFSKLIGLTGHFKRVADKERTFAEENGRGARKSKFPPSTLVLTKLIALPGEKAVGKSNGAATTVAPTTSAPAASSGDIDTDTWPYLEAVLKNNGGTFQRGKLTLKVSQAAAANARRTEIAKRAAEESYINSLVELGMVTYAAAEKGQPVSLVA